MVEQTKHCVLCKHGKRRLKDGMYCGVTNRKANFQTSCPHVTFSHKLFEEVNKTNIELEKIKRSKLTNYFHFLTFIIISLGVFWIIYLLRSYFFQTYTSVPGYYSFKGSAFSFIIPIIFAAIGVKVMAIAFGYFNKFKNDLSFAKDKKEQIDLILNVYNIKYEIGMDFGKKYLGMQEVQTKLNFNDYSLIDYDKKNTITSSYRIDNL